MDPNTPALKKILVGSKLICCGSIVNENAITTLDFIPRKVKITAGLWSDLAIGTFGVLQYIVDTTG